MSWMELEGSKSIWDFRNAIQNGGVLKEEPESKGEENENMFWNFNWVHWCVFIFDFLLRRWRYKETKILVKGWRPLLWEPSPFSAGEIINWPKVRFIPSLIFYNYNFCFPPLFEYFFEGYYVIKKICRYTISIICN